MQLFEFLLGFVNSGTTFSHIQTSTEENAQTCGVVEVCSFFHHTVFKLEYLCISNANRSFTRYKSRWQQYTVT